MSKREAGFILGCTTNRSGSGSMVHLPKFVALQIAEEENRIRLQILLYYYGNANRSSSGSMAYLL